MVFTEAACDRPRRRAYASSPVDSSAGDDRVGLLKSDGGAKSKPGGGAN